MALIGIEDEAFIRGDVPMTKQEIRVLTLVKARILPGDIVWDIGAGTGSISVEAARLAPEGHVYAVERKPEGVRLIRANAEKFAVKNLTAIEAEAPEGLDALPAPDAVIIGGSGRRLEPVLDIIAARLKTGGRVILNCITVQTLASCLAYMRGHKDLFHYEAIQVQINRLQAAGPYDMAQALNPIHIVTCWKN
ncbi:MAG: precorrin-6Y C5,15-methyltransferase (decarboxylating) subunit CbiT [Schwartzia sp.]|nr:precorrin-6Y C5,15-methyltransferase (decarboxylating) subunit CbiT [Schwartzia sp. (in: firmicutes)]